MRNLLLVIVHVFCLVAASPLEFIEAPANITALLGDADVSFVCHIQGDSLFWRINNRLYNFASFNEFANKGIRANVIHTADGSGEEWERLSVRVSLQNNHTKVVCQRTVFGQISNYSEPAFLIIPDVPLPPAMRWSVQDMNTLLLTWTEPFTWTQYPITGYSIIIGTANTTSSESMVLTNFSLGPSTHSYTVTSGEVPRCTLLVITMAASSSVGRSEATIIHSALPEYPDTTQVETSIRYEIMNTDNGTPHLTVWFDEPEVCPLQEPANYTMEILDDGGNVVASSGLQIAHGGSNGTISTRFMSGLASNTNYSIKLILSHSSLSWIRTITKDNISISSLKLHASTAMMTIPPDGSDTTSPGSDISGVRSSTNTISVWHIQMVSLCTMLITVSITA